MEVHVVFLIKLNFLWIEKYKREVYDSYLHVVDTPYNSVGYEQIPDGRGHNVTRERSIRVSLWPRTPVIIVE